MSLFTDGVLGDGTGGLGGSSGEPTPLEYDDVAHTFLQDDTRVAGECRMGVINGDNTSTSSHAYLAAKSGGSAGGDAGLVLENGVVTWKVALMNALADRLDFMRGASLYFSINPGGDQINIGPSGSITSRTLAVSTTAASGGFWPAFCWEGS